MFKDLRELYMEKAQTAYGSEEVVPLDVDILVAGTSCKDYSSKNNFKKVDHGVPFNNLVDFIRFAGPPRPALLQFLLSTPALSEYS